MMGNSRTSRYADGRDLYHADSETQRWLRALAQRARHAPPRASRVPRVRLPRARANLRSLPSRPATEPRRFAGEVHRLLLDPEAGPRIRRLAARHHLDEGDVALLWAHSILQPAEPTLPLSFVAEAEPA